MKKLNIILALLLMTTLDCFSQSNETTEIRNSVISGGIGMGTVLAVVISWERNKSVLLAFLHGIFSWFYVIYFVSTRKPSERR